VNDARVPECLDERAEGFRRDVAGALLWLEIEAAAAVRAEPPWVERAAMDPR
jgi:hypothetical protein